MTHCPHCSWDLRLVDIPDPDDTDKISFLASFLGSKPWRKTYALLGGRMSLELRSLTVQEIDACYRQVERDVKAERVRPTFGDRMEALNRYTACLQIRRVTLAGGSDIAFPDGLISPQYNATATDFWEIPAGDTEANFEPLRVIEQEVNSKLLSQHAMARTVRVQIAAFNRLLEKLEVQVPNAPFWKGIELPP